MIFVPSYVAHAYRDHEEGSLLIRTNEEFLSAEYVL